MFEKDLNTLRAYYERTVKDLVRVLLYKDEVGRSGKDTQHYDREISKLALLKETIGEVIEEAQALLRAERLPKNG